MPGGVRINPQVVKGRWWYLKHTENTQKPVNRIDLFTGRSSSTPQQNNGNNFSSSKAADAQNNTWGDAKKSW